MQNDAHALPYDESPSKSRHVEERKAGETGSRSFKDTLTGVRRQIEIDCFRAEEKAQAEEIALIIAEVMRLPPDAPVRIAGEVLPAEMTAEIYTRLTHEHVEQVIINFRKAAYEIKYVKTYLRTALYNAVFEVSSRICNDVSTEMYGEAKNRK